MNIVATAPRRASPRLWIGALVFGCLAALAVWGAWSLGHALWLDASGIDSDLDVTVNGQPWIADGLGGLLGWALAAAVMGGLLLVALMVVLPMALGGVLVLVLLLAGLVLGAIALPVLLVLGLLLSPLLLLGGLGWILLG